MHIIPFLYVCPTGEYVTNILRGNSKNAILYTAHTFLIVTVYSKLKSNLQEYHSDFCALNLIIYYYYILLLYHIEKKKKTVNFYNKCIAGEEAGI